MLNAKKSIRKMLFGNKKSSIRSPSSSNVNSLISPTQKTEKKIPLVIDMEERIKIDKIEKKTQSNHRLNIIGLRVSEVINLNYPISTATSCKLRSVELKVKRPPCTTNRVPEILRLYYIGTNQMYLFNGQFGLQYSDNSCNAIVKKIHRQTIPHAHLAPQCSNRTIRKGTDLKLIGDLLGHSSRKTTEIHPYIE
jgi:site-specific recombinase XerD